MYYSLWFFCRKPSPSAAVAPKEVPRAASCFVLFNEVCDRALIAVLEEANRLNSENGQSFDLEGVNVENPVLSTVPLPSIIESIQGGLEFTSHNVIVALFATLYDLLLEFYDVVSRDEIHIILGSYRSQHAQGFLLNPCSFQSENPVEDYYEMMEESFFLGAILKSVYITNVLGLPFPTSHELFNACTNNEQYPSLVFFKDFGQRVHIQPV